MPTFLRRHRQLLATVFAGLLVGGLAGAGILVVSFVQQSGSATVVPSAPPTPSPSAVAINDVMDELHGDCTACHLRPGGGVGTKPIPPIGHPLDGWTNCTGCHAPDKLVNTAPGHSGIHADQCLVCHKSGTPAAAMRPHGDQKVGNCLSCHGKSAPLPASMEGRSAATCWLCHRASTTATPDIPHPVEGNAACETCHVAGKIGALPASHETRADTTCTACHALKTTTAPLAPHSLVGLDGKCATCHAPGVSPGPLPSPGTSAGPSGTLPSPSP
jgi:hypothetical protein